MIEDKENDINTGKGTDLVLTVYNKATKETIVVDASEEGEQFVLAIAKAKANSVFVATCCGTNFMVEHLMHLIQNNKEASMVAFVIATTTGILDKEEFKNVKMHKINIGDNEMPPRGGVPPTTLTH